MWMILYTILKNDLKRYARNRMEVFLPLCFFVLIVFILSMTAPLEQEQLQLMGPSMIWVAVLLALIFSLDLNFRKELLEGGLEQLLLSPHSLPLLIATKLLAHVLVIGLPLMLAGTLAGFALNFSTSMILALFLSFFLGIPALDWMILMGVGLTVSLEKGGMLLSILVLPLVLPGVLLSLSAVKATIYGLSFRGELSLLTAFLISTWSVGPFAVSAVLRLSQK